MSEKTEWITQELENLKTQGLYNRIRTIGSPQGAWLVVDGKRVLNFCSNNYLGLANHPNLVLQPRNLGPAMGLGRPLCAPLPGRWTLHLELERRLAAFKACRSRHHVPMRFHRQSCNHPGSCRKEDVIFSDRLNHASIIDGAPPIGWTNRALRSCGSDSIWNG